RVGSDSGRRTLHVARGRTRLDLRAQRFARWPVPDTLRAARITGAQSALFARHRPGGQLVHPPREPFCSARRSTVSVCTYNLSSDRASYGGWYVAILTSSRRTPAGNVRRNFARTGYRTQDQE